MVAWIRTALLGFFHPLSLSRRVNKIVQHDKMLSHIAKTTCTLCIFPLRDAPVSMEQKREREYSPELSSPAPKSLCVFMLALRWSITIHWWFVARKCCSKSGPLLKLFSQETNKRNKTNAKHYKWPDLKFTKCTANLHPETKTFFQSPPASLSELFPWTEVSKIVGSTP